MRSKGPTIAVLAVLCLTPFAPGCTSLRQFGSLGNSVWRPWTWFKSEAIRNDEIKRFASTVRPQPGNPVAHYHLGSHYLQSGRYEEAIWELEKATTIKPDYFEAFNLLAVSYDRLGDFGKAEKAYRTAIQINPNAAYVYNNLGHSFILQAKWQDALDNLKKAVTLNGDKPSPRMYNNLGTVYVMIGRYEEGMAAFEEAGSKAEAHYNMARAYAYKGLAPEAHKQYELALQLDPTSSAYRNGLKECEEKAEAMRLADHIRQAVAQPGMDAARSPAKASEITLNDIGIEISNGNGVARFARKISRFLKERGFEVVRLTNADTFDCKETKIYYRKGYGEASQALAKEMPEIPKMEEVSRLDRSQVKVKMVLGKDLASHQSTFAGGNK